MKNTFKIIPCYSADTSGVCSAFYELGGMTVVHDASGCNSTYSTHDEPRWYDQRSMIYISALTEMDAVMGNDEKLICDTLSAIKDQQPEFCVICGSPMPMMTGVDFDAIAAEIQQRSGVRTFAVKTNGTHSYLKGAASSMLVMAESFTSPCEKTKGIGVNILGATPLDISAEMIESTKDCLTQNGFVPVCCMAMGSTLEELGKAAGAAVDLVVSYSGLAAAKFMLKKYGIPYVCGIPMGEAFGKVLAQNIWLAAQEGTPLYPCAERNTDPWGIQVIGESIFAGSLAAALSLEKGAGTRVICPLDHEAVLLAKGDLALSAEEDIEAALKAQSIRGIAADPLYRYISPENVGFYEVPHFAFSGRCYMKKMKDLIKTPIGEISV